VKASFLLIASLLAAMAVGGCAAREQLITKSAVVPAGTDLSGRWLLRVADRDSVKRIDDAELAAAGGLESIVPKKGRGEEPRRRSSSSGAFVHVFLETGKSLKVTQTDDGLFISFDRSVVEEYRFGENRVISVGPVEADRVSGWSDGAYVIETLDQDGVKLIEEYRLGENGIELHRSISIHSGEQQQLAVEQVFDQV
jgi:hypothetical protein